MAFSSVVHAIETCGAQGLKVVFRPVAGWVNERGRVAADIGALGSSGSGTSLAPGLCRLAAIGQ